MRGQHWLRFVPKRVKQMTVRNRDDVFTRALAKLETLRADDFQSLDREIDMRKRLANETDASDWLALLIMQAPRAAHAQIMMSENPKGYHDREARLFELIDFNDTFVATVLLLPDKELPSFPDKLRQAAADFCKRMYSQSFHEEHFSAIVHGLSREIAVYKAAQNAGLDVVMGSRVADSLGVDMQIRDQNTGRYISIDCKTSSSFHFRLKNLIKQHRMKPSDLVDAETKGWWEIVNRDNDRKHKVILLRVSQDDLGEIRAFRFVNEQMLIERIKQIIMQRSVNDGQFGKL